MQNNLNTNLTIAVSGLCKNFNHQPAVQNVTLKVKKGEIFGFLGPNGSGKTTTIRMLCGLLTPDAGGGTCLGYDILNNAATIKLHVGYMTQHCSLYNDLTVYENLNFAAHLYELKHPRELINATMHELGLESRKNQLVQTLSGGWKQRLSLAVALLHRPQLLLLDEPTAGVDPKARREFWDHIHHLATHGITVLVSTHYMDEAERCHSLCFMFDGKILIQGTKEEIIRDANLATWVVTGANLMSAAKIIRTMPGVEQVVAFGDSLHVTGKNTPAIHQSMQTFNHDNCQCLPITPGIEDIFIGLEY